MPTLADSTPYARWNAALASEFFGGRYGGRPVYVDLEEDTLGRLAAALELEDPDEAERQLVAAVAPTLGLAAGVALFGMHVRCLRAWRRRSERDTPPPIVAVLAFQSLVAEGMRGDQEFRASNYYGRFLQAVDRDPDDRRLRSKVVRGFGADSGELWSALNRWIAEDSDTRGIPTAYSFDYRVHVGLPMSQALVRASDRSAIRSLFSDLGLRPGQGIAVEDMIRLLEASLPDSRVSRGLKALCQQQDVVQRVAEVACVELQAWSGVVEDASSSSRTMALSAALRRLPRRSLRIGLSVRCPEGVNELVVDPGSDEAGAAAVADTGGRLRLGQRDDEDWRPVLSELSVPDLLFARLRVGSGRFRAARDPRTLVVLARSAAGGRFRETDRVRLGSEHLLLAVEPVRARVERELAVIARPGYRPYETLPGLPAGWIAFEGVEIVAISDTTAPDLAALIPLAWTEVAVEGGLRLPGRASWHSSAPPEIRATAPPGRVVALAVVREGTESTQAGVEPLEGDAGPPETDEPIAPSADPEALELFQEAAIVDLTEFDLGDGDYRVQLFENDLAGRALGATSFHLRSSSAPFFPIIRSTLAYATSKPLGAISAGADREGVQGALVLDANSPDAAPAAATTRDLSAHQPPVAEDDDEPEPPVAAQRRSSVPECFVTGAHHFMLESTTRGRRRWGQTFEGECRYCGLEKSFPARPRRRGAPPGAARRLSAAASAPAVPSVRQEEPLDHDLLLDALSCVGAGTFAAFEQLVGQRDDRPWAAAETARALASLGHLDVELDDHLRPRRWSISPPALVASPAGAFLAGWRSPELLFDMGRIAHEVGGRVEWIRQPNGPFRVGLLGVDKDDLERIAAEIAARRGIAIGVEREAPLRLAGALPRLAALRSELPRVPAAPASTTLQRLDVESMRWLPAPSARLPGAYRTVGPPRVVMHGDGYDLRVADARLAKWLASERSPLLAYDAERHRALCHRGAEPPWLFERALVLCSGLLPIPVEGHLVEYGDVDPAVAAALIARLGASLGVNA